MSYLDTGRFDASKLRKEKAHERANSDYRKQLVREATHDDLDLLVDALNARLARNVSEYTDINSALTEALEQREQRRTNRG